MAKRSETSGRDGVPKQDPKRKPKGGPKRGKKKSPARTAANSDRHELYELAVQSPEAEVEFIDRVTRKALGRRAQTLREDFCGTAFISAEWVAKRKNNRAIGVDLDPKVLKWGAKRLRDRLNAEQRTRLTMVEGDVRTTRSEPVEALCAFNFSYFIFKERAELIGYFRAARESLVPGGVLLLDAYGGSDSFVEMEEERQLDGFVYVWDQHKYNPITGDVVNHIHFRFPDGSEMKRAFTYRWRLWTLPELQDALAEAGFEEIAIHWEGTDEKSGGGDGVFRPSRKGEACAGWIAYITARRP